MNGIDAWGDPQTSWHEKWAALLIHLVLRPEVKVDVNDAYGKWLQTVAGRYEGKIPFLYISEIHRKVKIPKGSTYYADAVVNNNQYLLLINRELSKVEILTQECVFGNVVWLVNYTGRAKHLIDNNQAMEIQCPRFKSVDEYKRCLTEEIVKKHIKITKWLLAEGHHNVYSDYKPSAIQNIKSDIVTLTAYRDELNATPNLLDNCFDEDNWDDCYWYPDHDDYINRLKYSLCPVCFDLGDGVYVKKETFMDFGRKRSYLKKLSYEDFIRWATA